MFAKLGWIRRLFYSKSYPAPKRVRLGIEALEDRFALSVNHAPIGADTTVITLEDTPYVFTASDFGFSDPGDTPANNFLAVKIATTPVSAMLNNNGMPVGAGMFVSLSDISAGNLVLTPMMNVNGPGATNFSFQVRDDGGTENGGVDLDPTARTMTVDVTPVNDAPSLMAFNPPDTDMGIDPVEIPYWAMFSPGGGIDESTQTATYTVTNVSNPSLFAAMPAVAPDGKLSYTLNLYASGSTTFDVKVQDSGGAANGGQDTSPVSTFTLVVRSRVTFRVNTVNDSNDANVQNSQPLDGRALDINNQTSLRAAVQEGNNFPAGTIVSINFTGMGTINLGTALPNLNRNFRITGLGSTFITIQRQSANAFRIFTMNAGTEVVIRDLTIANGAAAGVAPANSGGGILNGGRLEIYGVVFEGNSAELGGGIGNAAGAELLVYNSDLHSNSATNSGGGIFNNGQAWISSNTAIYVNEAQYGGGIFNFTGAQLTVNGGAQIYSNTATQRGGGIFNAGDLVMVDSTRVQLPILQVNLRL
ncbi:MAG: hypothetical protein HYX68_18260 [Planctomycetes bacterium]|nr:hypothetical protein [Planctomycetota bacterium]